MFALGGQGAAIAGDVDVAQGVQIAVTPTEAIEGVGAQAGDLTRPVDASEGAARGAFLIHDLEDGVIERLLPAPDGALEQGRFIEAPAGLQRQALDRQVAGLRADAFYGFSWRDGDLDALRYVNIAGNRGALTAKGKQEATGLDVFAEGRLFVTERLALVAGGSWGRATRDYRDHLAPANDDSIDYDWFSPRLGLLWEAEDGAQVFANVTRSVEPPTYGALVQAPLAGFVPVEVQDAWTAEIGTRGRRGAFAWDLTAYRSQIDGEMLNFITGPDIPAATFNADKTIHQGIEAGLDWRLPVELADGSLLLRQTWTWSDFRFDGDARWGDNRLPVVPEHQYRAELTWRHASGLFITPSVEWRISSP